ERFHDADDDEGDGREAVDEQLHEPGTVTERERSRPPQRVLVADEARGAKEQPADDREDQETDEPALDEQASVVAVDDVVVGHAAPEHRILLDPEPDLEPDRQALAEGAIEVGEGLDAILEGIEN